MGLLAFLFGAPAPAHEAVTAQAVGLPPSLASLPHYTTSRDMAYSRRDTLRPNHFWHVHNAQDLSERVAAAMAEQKGDQRRDIGQLARYGRFYGRPWMQPTAPWPRFAWDTARREHPYVPDDEVYKHVTGKLPGRAQYLREDD